MSWEWKLATLAGCMMFALAAVAPLPSRGLGPGPVLTLPEPALARPAGGGDVVVFVVDSPVEPRFVTGSMVGMGSEDISHGSLVARVIRSYCRATLVSVPAEDMTSAVDRYAYLKGLDAVLRYCLRHPTTRVLVNISLGRSEQSAEEQRLLRRIHETGALVIAAAGNEDSDEPFYPAAYPGVVAVANATRKGKTLSSNYGAHIAICASGDITFIDYEFLPYEWLRRQMQARGTSFAAPRVTATLAYLMRKRPGMSPGDALDLAKASAAPISDPLFSEGKLGAGALDIYRAKVEVHPLHRFIHYVLPVALGIGLVAATVLLCAWRGLIGVFISLLLWVVFVPSGVLLVIWMRRYVEFVGAGYREAGPLPFALVGGALLGGAAVLRLSAKNMARAFLPAGLAGVVLAAAEMGALVRAVLVSAMVLALAALLEWHTRRVLAGLVRLPEQAGTASACRRLARVWERAVDERVRRSAEGTALQLPPEEALAWLGENTRHPRGAEALAELIRQNAPVPPDGAECGPPDEEDA